MEPQALVWLFQISLFCHGWNEQDLFTEQYVGALSFIYL